MSIGDATIAPDAITRSITRNEPGPVEEWLAAGNSADSISGPGPGGRGNMEHGDPLLVTAVDCYCGGDPASYAILELLLSAGATVDLKSREDGCTALMVAANLPRVTGKQKVLNLLIDHGADVDLQNDKGETALMHAALNGSIDVVVLLLRAGAMMDVRDEGSFTSEELAVVNDVFTKYVLADVRLGGGWTRYVRQPVLALNVLRVLCHRGRATIPWTSRASRVLARLFDKRFPGELFVQVLLYWRSARATGEDRAGDKGRLQEERRLRRL